MIPNRLRAVLLVLISILWAASVYAEPILKATFTKSGKQPVNCELCLPEWTNALNQLFAKVSSSKVITGHIVLVDLSDPRLEPLVTDRDPNNDICGNFVGTHRHNPTAEQLLPVHLKTVPDWAIEVNADIAFSGGFFKFQNEGGVRADPACGEIIGVNLRNGHLDWPPIDHPEMLQDLIDNNSNWPVSALLLNANHTAEIKYLSAFEDLEDAAYGISGSALYIDDWENPMPGSKPGSALARLGVGILDDPTKIIIIMLEGNNNKKSNKQDAVGHRIARLRTLMHLLGAVSAINLDGSGSAHIEVRDPALGQSSRPADTEGARPIANHFGFRVLDEAATWVGYVPPQQDND